VEVKVEEAPFKLPDLVVAWGQRFHRGAKQGWHKACSKDTSTLPHVAAAGTAQLTTTTR